MGCSELMKVVVGVQKLELFYLLIQMEGQSCLLNVLRTGLQPVAQVVVPVTRLPVCDGNSSHGVVCGCVFGKWCRCVGMVDDSKSEMIVVGLNVTSSAAILCYKMSKMICFADDGYDMSSMCSGVWCRAE